MATFLEMMEGVHVVSTCGKLISVEGDSSIAIGNVWMVWCCSDMSTVIYAVDPERVEPVVFSRHLFSEIH